MKRFLTVILAAMLACSAFVFASCKQNTGSEVISGGTGENGELEIVCRDAGYGLDWLRNIARAFSEQYDVNVTIDKSTNSGPDISLVLDGQSPYDIVMTVGSQHRAIDEGMVEDLTDTVYNKVPKGEEKTVADKMDQNYYNRLLRDDGKIYNMNWCNSVSGIFYNQTMLDKYLDEWELPNTTTELMTLCERVKEAKQYAFSLSTGSAYWDYMTYVWAAQYCGVQTYFDYYDIVYRDADGKAHTAEKYDDLSAANEARALVLEFESQLLNSANGYVHKQAKSMDYLQSQIAFAGNGFRTDKTECAFIVSGDWMENELAQYLAKNPQTIGYMPTPVFSGIVAVLDDKTMKDSELSELVGFIDADMSLEDIRKEEGWSDLTQHDYDKIAQARNMAYVATMDHMVTVPTTAKNKENAYNFLVFLASDQAGKIYADALEGRSLIYGYTPDTSQSSFFTQTTVAAIEDCEPVYVDYSSPYVYLGGFRYIAVDNRYLNMYDGIDASKIESDICAHWVKNWPTILESGLKK